MRDTTTVRMLVAVMTASALLEAPASCQTALDVTAAPTETQEAAIPVLMSVSGGISLGSYQAGVNWALVEFFRHTRESSFRAGLTTDDGPLPRYELAVLTGASAGNINSILSALEWCRGSAAQEPENSLFWRIWTTTGVEQLMPHYTGAGSRTNAAFHRRFFEEHHFPLIRERMQVDVDPQCGQPLPIGITLTRIQPASITLADSRVEAKTQRFASVIAGRARQPQPHGSPATFAFEQWGTDSVHGLGELALLPSDRHGLITTDHVFGLSEASSAFPVAFEPRRLSYCSRAEINGRMCRPSQHDFFSDGGLFDNNPLDLALTLYSRRRPQDIARGVSPLVIYINPGQLRGTLEESRRESNLPPQGYGFAALQDMLAGALPSARQYELHSLARALDRDTLLGRGKWIHATTRSYPIIGEHLGAFAAFLGRPFREYDFYVGMYDAFHFIAFELLCSSEHARPDCGVNRLRQLIDGEIVNVGDAAPLVMTPIFMRDFPTAPLAPRQSESEDIDRRKVFSALVRANGLLLQRNPRLSCDGLGLVDARLCSTRFKEVLDALQADRDLREVITRWSRSRACVTRAFEQVAECRAEPSMLELISRPEVTINQMITQALSQLWNVEQYRKSIGESSTASSLELVQVVYPYLSARYRRGFKEPSSVPAVDGLANVFHAVPHYFSVDLGHRNSNGFEAELGSRLMYQFGPRVAVVVPLVPIHFRRGRVRDHNHTYGSAMGLGVSIPSNNLRLSSLDLIPLELFRSWREERSLVATEAALYIAAGKIRVSYRYMWNNATSLQAGKDHAVQIGVSDINGVLYWLFH